jgi:hypothetical protein
MEFFKTAWSIYGILRVDKHIVRLFCIKGEYTDYNLDRIDGYYLRRDDNPIWKQIEN